MEGNIPISIAMTIATRTPMLEILVTSRRKDNVGCTIRMPSTTSKLTFTNTFST